jgi:hypothetical protein
MAGTIQCDTHGENHEAFVCSHLVGYSFGRGFHRAEPTNADPFPDAFCDDCQLIYESHGCEWNDEVKALINISLICSRCYNHTRARNTRTEVKLDDLKELRWKCGTCEEWHSGPILDLGFDAPFYWSNEHARSNGLGRLLPAWSKRRSKTFLDVDYCAIDDEKFFACGLIQLPIVGTAESFGWGVWGSLSRENFYNLREMDDNPKKLELPTMFSWLSSRIDTYPDTLSLKMYAHIQGIGDRPKFELEYTDHPLSQEYHHGITPERVKELTINRFGGYK